jgi:hypothetical protein
MCSNENKQMEDSLISRTANELILDININSTPFGVNPAMKVAFELDRLAAAFKLKLSFSRCVEHPHQTTNDLPVFNASAGRISKFKPVAH